VGGDAQMESQVGHGTSVHLFFRATEGTTEVAGPAPEQDRPREPLDR